MSRSPASRPTRSGASWAISRFRAPRTVWRSGRSRVSPTRRSSTPVTERGQASTPRSRRSGRGRSVRGSSPNTCCAKSRGPSPPSGKRAITPFSEEDMKTLLANGERSRTYTRPGKRACDHAVTTALRNRTIILLLSYREASHLDTGVRASWLPEGEPDDQGRRSDEWPKATYSASASRCWARGTRSAPCRHMRCSFPSPRARRRRYGATLRPSPSEDKPVNAPLFLGSEGDPHLRPGRAAQAADTCGVVSRPAGGQSRRAGLPPAPVLTYVRGEFPVPQGGCAPQRREHVRAADSVPRLSGHGAGAHDAADSVPRFFGHGADVPGAGPGGPGRGASQGVAGGDLEVVAVAHLSGE